MSASSQDLGFRSSGLSFHGDDNPYYKTNVYSLPDLGSAAGVMQADGVTGMVFLEVIHDLLAVESVVGHEFGHGVHYHQQI
jgi:hypothetical protein